MTRIILAFLLLHFISPAFAGTISGRVTDQNGQPLAYASITVSGSKVGTTTNSQGRYQLNLSPGTYLLQCQYVGYARLEKEVILTRDPQTVDFMLVQQPLTLQEVIVKKGEDPAYEIIRQAIAKREYYNNQVDSLSVKVYIKGLMRSDGLPKRLMGQKIERSADDGLDSLGRGIVFLSESVTEVDLVRPDQIKYRVISSRESGGGYGLSFPFFINFYQNNVSVFGNNLNPRGFISPIANGALHYYRFRYQGSFVEDGKMVNTIQVIPRRKNEPLFSGTIQITEDDWRIHSLDLKVTRDQQLELLDTIRITQLHQAITPDVWRTGNQVLALSFAQFGFKIRGNFVNVYSDYDLNPGFEKKHFGRTLMKYDTSFNKKDSLWWSLNRPVNLEPDEKRDFTFKDSINQLRRDSTRLGRVQLDSLRRLPQPVTVKNLLLDGQGHQFYGEKSTVSWRMRGLIKALEYNTVEGLVMQLDQRLTFNKRGAKRTATLDWITRYGFSNTHLNSWGALSVRPRSLPFRNRYLTLSGGKRVSQFNPDEPIDVLTNAAYTLLDRRNYMKIYENWFAAIEYNNRFESGFELHLFARFEDRIPLRNTTDFSIFGKDERAFLPNHPIELADRAFEKHQAALVGFRISWQPGQRYIEFPRYKMPLGSSAPVFELQYQKGINDVLGSDVDFDKWRFSMQHSINLKVGGEFKYKLGVGGFLNSDSVGIPDLQHFNGNQTFYNFKYLNSFQLAPYYKYSNDQPFFAFGHVEHHFNGLLTNKIPLFNRLKWNLVAGANTFYVNKDNYYLELSAGLENILKLFRVDVVTAIQPGAGNTWGVRVGLGGLIGGKVRFTSSGN
ncbi:MAG: DUF5686 and carboxypeptidase regulatory-like domain-containing protein [Chitinophagaceae bacterium]